MHTAFIVFTILVILIHIFIMILEMFFWTKPYGLKAFKMSPQKAQESSVLAMNQGLYNGVLALGLIYALVDQNLPMHLFLLFAIAVLGIFGGLTVHRKIIFIQALPAILGLIFFYL